MTADNAQSSECTLPHEKVFSIQIGTKLFRLSGASIASDAPSYFSRFFEDQLRQNSDGNNIRTLYIDRDPVTFREIARHLQGYHVNPKDGPEYVKLFADSQFYSLPRLMSQLFESQIFIQIGDRHFQISRDIFSAPGDSPNFFSLGFGAFFASPQEVFPGLDRRELLRPPAIIPPVVTHRSGDIFAQLIHLLRGYPLDIETEAQRAALLRDCRYFHLRGLEQKIIPHHISFNPISRRSEITIRLEDVRRSGIHVDQRQDSNGTPPGSGTGAGLTVKYARPFVDDSPHDLVLEIGDESTLLDLRTMRPTFLNSTKSRIASLLQIIIDKKDGASASQTPTPPAGGASALEPLVCVYIGEGTDLTVDGEQQAAPNIRNILESVPDANGPQPQTKRRRVEGPEPDLQTQSLSTSASPAPHYTSTSIAASTPGAASGSYSRPAPPATPGSNTWVVRSGQWRVSTVPRANDSGVQFVMVGVKLDVYTRQRERNRKRAFLGS
ncbi:hypothetical protein BDV19DRAFT_44398 [Aspergillus venezuelensis]